MTNDYYVLRDPKGFGAIRRISPKENGEVHVHFRERALAEDVSLFFFSVSPPRSLPLIPLKT